MKHNRSTHFDFRATSIPANPVGRDFIVGDLHGRLGALNDLLAGVCFEPEKDRLFSTGNLVSHGEDSLGCLRLLKQAWFFPVRGSTDAMLCAYLLGSQAEWHDAADFLHNGGKWIKQVPSDEKTEISDLAWLLLDLPTLLQVEHPAGNFQVVHASLPAPTPDQSDALLLPSYGERALWNRAPAVEALHAVAAEGENPFIEQADNKKCCIATEWLTSTTPWQDGRPLTYAGHVCSGHKRVLHQSMLLIDGGARDIGREPDAHLVLLEHAATMSRLNQLAPRK